MLIQSCRSSLMAEQWSGYAQLQVFNVDEHDGPLLTACRLHPQAEAGMGDWGQI